MSDKRLIIYGAGGHANVVADAAVKSGWEITAFADDNTPGGQFINGIKVCRYEELKDEQAFIVIAIGNNKVRELLAKRVIHPAVNIIHPTAVISAGVTLGTGNVILANAVIQANTTIGDHCIVNALVCIDHDARMGDFAHVYPTSYIGPFACVQNLETITPGACVKQ
jgi:acetyltransferase EpsM